MVFVFNKDDQEFWRIEIQAQFWFEFNFNMGRMKDVFKLYNLNVC